MVGIVGTSRPRSERMDMRGLDLQVDAIESGGQIVSTADMAKLAGVTATAAELNKLTGTAAGLTAAELSILDGVTADAGELNLVDGATIGVVVASKAVLQLFADLVGRKHAGNHVCVLEVVHPLVPYGIDQMGGKAPFLDQHGANNGIVRTNRHL